MQGDVVLARHKDGYRFQAERPMGGSASATRIVCCLPGRSAGGSRRTWIWDGSWCLPRKTTQVDRGPTAQRRENAAPSRSGAKVRNSEAGAVQSTRPSFGRHRKSEGRIARRSRQGEDLAMPLGKTRNREIGKIKKG